MPEPPVVNASPLILLAQAGLMDLLKLAGEPVLVPVAERLRATGLYLSEQVLNQALALVGE